MRKIFAHILVQDGLPDVLRTIESLYLICDEIFVIDGRSTDGTREFLEDRKKIYNLTLFDRPFDTVQKQRQFLLTQTPKDNWIISLDQDESISIELKKVLRKLLLSFNPVDSARKYPYVVKIPYFTLMNDISHYSVKDYTEIASKVLFYDRNLEWKYDFHCVPVYPNEEERVSGQMLAPLAWCIFHFAWLDPKRMKERQGKQMKYYSPDEWDYKKKVIKKLPEGVFV